MHLGPCRLTEPPRATLGGAQATRPSWAGPSAQQPEASSRTLSGAFPDPPGGAVLPTVSCTWPGALWPSGHLSPPPLGSRTESLPGPAPAWHGAQAHLTLDDRLSLCPGAQTCLAVRSLPPGPHYHRTSSSADLGAGVREAASGSHPGGARLPHARPRTSAVPALPSPGGLGLSLRHDTL